MTRRRVLLLCGLAAGALAATGLLLDATGLFICNTYSESCTWPAFVFWVARAKERCKNPEPLRSRSRLSHGPAE